MAKHRTADLTFSSEKLESQERQKRILIIVAALLLVAVAAVGIGAIARSMRGARFSGGADTPYPYTWRSDSKGVMTVEIDHSAAPGQSWILLDTDATRMSVLKAEKQPEKSSRFTLTPTGEGRFNAIFLLMNENEEASARLDMLMETTESEKGVLQTDVVSSSLTERQTAAQGGEGSYYPYSYGTNADGWLVVTVENGSAWNDWDCVCDNEAAAVSAGIFYEEKNVVLYLMPGTEPGSCGAKLYSEEGSVAIDLGLELTQESTLLVRSDSLTGGDVPPPEEDEEHDLGGLFAEPDVKPEEISEEEYLELHRDEWENDGTLIEIDLSEDSDPFKTGEEDAA